MPLYEKFSNILYVALSICSMSLGEHLLKSHHKTSICSMSLGEHLLKSHHVLSFLCYSLSEILDVFSASIPLALQDEHLLL